MTDDQFFQDAEVVLNKSVKSHPLKIFSEAVGEGFKEHVRQELVHCSHILSLMNVAMPLYLGLFTFVFRLIFAEIRRGRRCFEGDRIGSIRHGGIDIGGGRHEDQAQGPKNGVLGPCTCLKFPVYFNKPVNVWIRFSFF